MLAAGPEGRQEWVIAVSSRVRYPVCAVVMLLAGFAHAGLTGVSGVESDGKRQSFVPDAGACVVSAFPQLIDFTAINPTYDFIPEQSQASGSLRTVTSIPPAPDSASLFLFAMGTVGAWQVTRTLRKVQISAVPDWVHTAGPSQIGHATVLDVDVDVIPLCFYDRPEQEPVVCRLIDFELPRHFDSQCVLTSSASRAPPSLL